MVLNRRGERRRGARVAQVGPQPPSGPLRWHCRGRAARAQPFTAPLRPDPLPCAAGVVLHASRVRRLCRRAAVRALPPAHRAAPGLLCGPSGTQLGSGKAPGLHCDIMMRARRLLLLDGCTQPAQPSPAPHRTRHPKPAPSPLLSPPLVAPQADEVCRRCMLCCMRALLGDDDAGIQREAQVGAANGRQCSQLEGCSPCRSHAAAPCSAQLPAASCHPPHLPHLPTAGPTGHIGGRLAAQAGRCAGAGAGRRPALAAGPAGRVRRPCACRVGARWLPPASVPV